MYYTIIISSFAFLWSHGHNCDRDRFLPKLVVYSGVLVVYSDVLVVYSDVLVVYRPVLAVSSDVSFEACQSKGQVLK